MREREKGREAGRDSMLEFEVTSHETTALKCTNRVTKKKTNLFAKQFLKINGCEERVAFDVLGIADASAQTL
jgi:hypothetical protein